ncbi:MAG: hypothetical protein JSV01_05520 [Desulfobacterales bacterium]|nr:MAG: hypothetical protein JSV01_05520 [Desulfobacterales bacterium]
MCKKLVIWAMFAILLLGATIANSGEIRLKDGRFIEIERCWEKDGQVIFKLQADGRLFSLNKELVEEVVGQKNDQSAKQPAR